jgi:hypothetical protein
MSATPEKNEKQNKKGVRPESPREDAMAGFERLCSWWGITLRR